MKGDRESLQEVDELSEWDNESRMCCFLEIGGMMCFAGTAVSVFFRCRGKRGLVDEVV